jgi:hypothetical protein
MKTSHALLIGGSLIIAFFIFGAFFYAARGGDNTINVVGAATKRFDSDIVKWRITLSRTSDIKDLAAGYKLLQNDVETLRKLLKEKNIEDKDITIQPINSERVYGPQGQTSTYNIQQGLYLITSDIASVEELALNPAALLDKGVILQNSNLEYLNSKLADIKMALLSEATKDALKRAEEIAKNSGAELGPVSSLRAGVFQINEPFSNEVSDYGMYNTQAKIKDITVTVRAAFKIK